jgi:O-methyltransferase involved in polyketide biosynthesis
MTMKQLTEVSETALITLRSRVVESRKTNPLLHDPVGEELFNMLTGLESYHSGIKVRGEWSYFEDPDVKPAILKLFRHSKALSKTQYSVMADIN